jgi:hypothetical protein
MSKKPLKPASTELVTPGQPSAALVAKLKAFGGHITVPQITTALNVVEVARADFATKAVLLGVMLAAKREWVERGRWQVLLAEVWAGLKRSGSGAATFVPDPDSDVVKNFTRSLRDYCFLGRQFLADLEQREFPREGRDIASQPPALAVEDVLSLEQLPRETRAAVSAELERFVAGRSLRRMLMDFRRAECAADQEEIKEEGRRRKKAAPPAAAGQMEMFDEFLRPLGELDTLFDTPSFVKRTDRKFWLSVADKLETQARRARQLAKEIAS